MCGCERTSETLETPLEKEGGAGGPSPPAFLGWEERPREFFFIIQRKITRRRLSRLNAKTHRAQLACADSRRAGEIRTLWRISLFNFQGAGTKRSTAGTSGTSTQTQTEQNRTEGCCWRWDSKRIEELANLATSC